MAAAVGAALYRFHNLGEGLVCWLRGCEEISYELIRSAPHNTEEDGALLLSAVDIVSDEVMLQSFDI